LCLPLCWAVPIRRRRQRCDGEAGQAGAASASVFGCILIACGMMYLRLAALLALFNRQLMWALLTPFLTLAFAALAFGWLWTRRKDPSTEDVQREADPKNPLELMTAFMFAGLFLAMLIITQLAVTYLGKGGVDTLAAIMGIADVDPFIMGLTQTVGTLTR